MSLQPILDAPIQVQIHAGAALMALVLGPVALYRQRRDRTHKTVGYIWVIAMFTVALSAFFIHSFAVMGPFSPLHGFAILTFWSLWQGLYHARAGRIEAHQAALRGLYWYGLLIAGLANFLPDRRINQVVFGGNDDLGWIVIGLGIGLIIARLMRKRARQAQAA